MTSCELIVDVWGWGELEEERDERQAQLAGEDGAGCVEASDLDAVTLSFPFWSQVAAGKLPSMQLRVTSHC